MDFKVAIQSTPNPNALKFIVNGPVKTDGNVTYKNAGECEYNPVAGHLFALGNISEVYFFDNYITVTQDGNADWSALEEKIQTTILEHIANHDPNFKVAQAPKPETPQSTDPEIGKIDAILDRTVRPALQMDGGDLQVVNLDGNIVSIVYQGACGSCPSAAMGTKVAIENLLREEYKPDIVVELA